MAENQNGEQLCGTCNQAVPESARFCACGRPTATASFKERAEYEVKQWRAYKKTAS